MANKGKKRPEGRSTVSLKEMPFSWYHHVHHAGHTTSHLSLASCQAYGLGPRNQPPLARSGIDSAGQILPTLLLLILSITCLTSALCRYSSGPETSKYQSVMMHRTKHTLPHSLFQLFSLQVPLKTKSRKHLQPAAGRKNAHGANLQSKAVPFLLTFVIETGRRPVRGNTRERGKWQKQ